jgi:hypothetical protein
MTHAAHGQKEGKKSKLQLSLRQSSSATTANFNTNTLIFNIFGSDSELFLVRLDT